MVGPSETVGVRGEKRVEVDDFFRRDWISPGESLPFCLVDRDEGDEEKEERKDDWEGEAERLWPVFK